MGIESWMSSTQWASTYFCWTNCDSFNGFRIRICELFFHSFVFQECICADFFVTEMSIHIHLRSGLLPFSRYLVRFSNVFRVVLHFCLAFPGRPLSVWLLALPIPLQRDLGGGPRCRKPFDLRFEQSHGQCSLLVLWRKSWLQIISFARNVILDPALSAIVPNINHFHCVSNEFHMGLVRPFSSRNYSTPQNRLKIPWTSCVVNVLLPIVWKQACISSILDYFFLDRIKCAWCCKMCEETQRRFWTYWNTTRVSLNSSEITYMPIFNSQCLGFRIRSRTRMFSTHRLSVNNYPLFLIRKNGSFWK